MQTCFKHLVYYMETGEMPRIENPKGAIANMYITTTPNNKISTWKA